MLSRWLLALAIVHVETSFQSCYAAQFLLVSQFYHSHAQAMATIGDELHQRGHHVVVVAASALQFLNHKPYTVKYYQTSMKEKDMEDCLTIVLKHQDYTMSPCVKLIQEDLQAFTNDNQLLQELKSQHFAGLICDLGSYACQLVAEYIDIKIQVDVTSLGLVDPLVTSLFHIPNPPAYAPQIGLPLTCKMNLLQRTLNVIVRYTFMTIFHYLMLGHMYAAANITNLGLQTPPTFYNRRSSILIANGDFALDYPRPVTPATKVVGPILPKPAKALPIHLQEFVSANPNGTIVMSFGSVVTGLKYITDVQMLFKSLGRLPYNVICKYSEKHKYSIPKNVMTFNWLPQNDLLGHPNIKGFVTHCGMNSILEAAYHGVPMVGIPIFGDQIVNAQKILYRNIGVVLDINEINSDDLYFGIMNATTDQWILGNASIVSKLIKNRPNGRTPVEEAADWIEFALNSKGGHYLRSEEYNLPWYQLYLFDIFAILCMMIIITIIILKLIWRGIVFVFRRPATFSKAKQS